MPKQESLPSLLKQVILDPLIAKAVALDPKVVATVATALLTKLLLSQGIHLEGDFIPGYLSWSAAIALAAGAFAGWWKSNLATILRKPQPDGSPPIELVREKLPE